jgi:Fur family ferric uptake transcriptional regulator
MRNAELIFKQSGLKSTSSRLAVTDVLSQNNGPLSHQDLLKQLPPNFDRVTLYRVLDWLLNQHLIHKIAGADRAWRFQLNASAHAGLQYSAKITVSPATKMLNQHAHAHFQCESCGKVFCLDDIQPKLNKSLPLDFTVDSIEMNIKGKCAHCQVKF